MKIPIKCNFCDTEIVAEGDESKVYMIDVQLDAMYDNGWGLKMMDGRIPRIACSECKDPAMD